MKYIYVTFTVAGIQDSTREEDKGDICIEEFEEPLGSEMPLKHVSTILIHSLCSVF